MWYTEYSDSAPEGLDVGAKFAVTMASLSGSVLPAILRQSYLLEYGHSYESYERIADVGEPWTAFQVARQTQGLPDSTARLSLDHRHVDVH